MKDFKKLCYRCSAETIIAAFCFYIMKSKDTSAQIERYSVLKEYGLNDKVYVTIITHLCNHYQQKYLIPFS